MSNYAKAKYDVVDSLGLLAGLDTNYLSLVGDQSTAGSVSFTRIDESLVESAYPVSGSISVKGEEEEVIALQLGDAHRPNRTAIRSYALDELFDGRVTEQAFGQHLSAQGGVLVQDHPLAQGKSLRLNQTGEQANLLYSDDLVIESSDSQHLGINLDLKINDLRSRSRYLAETQPEHLEAGDNDASLLECAEPERLRTATQTTGTAYRRSRVLQQLCYRTGELFNPIGQHPRSVYPTGLHRHRS